MFCAVRLWSRLGTMQLRHSPLTAVGAFYRFCFGQTLQLDSLSCIRAYAFVFRPTALHMQTDAHLPNGQVALYPSDTTKKTPATPSIFYTEHTNGFHINLLHSNSISYTGIGYKIPVRNLLLFL